MRKYLFIFILFIMFLPFLAAQEDSAEWYVGKPIEDIVFNGLNKVSPKELSAITKPFIGKTFTEELFFDLQGKLYALDYFVQIIPNALKADGEGSAVIIEFTVKERPLVDELEIRGNQRIRRGDILDAVVLKKGDMITQSRLRLDEEAVRELYLKEGFPEVSVKAEIITEDDAHTVVFTISEGYQTTIREINFSGNSFASDSTLRGVLESKTQNIFNSGLYQEKNIEIDKENIRRYYLERGYVDIAILDVQTEKRRDEKEQRDYLTLTYYLEEGGQYNYEGISFEGNTIFSDEELAELVRQRPDGPVNMIKVEADYRRIVEKYWGDGYIFNKIDKQEIRNDEDNTIAFVISIVEQPRAHIENIIITGNEKTKDYVLKREIPLEVGDVFSRKKIIEGIQNLYNTQYFSNVTTDAPPGSAPGLMDLVINVEEQNTADIRFGIAFGGSSDFPISGQVSIQDINFLGRGLVLGGELIVSPVNQRLSGNFQENWLFGKSWSAGVNLTLDRSISSGQPQDILFPVFSSTDPNAVPDPYDGHYVYSDGSNAGQPYPGIPTQQEIDDNNLVTDYAYALLNDQTIADQYLMSYVTWNISLGLSTGYRFRTPIGQVRLSTSLRPSLSYVNYDASLYRPFDSNIRENWQQLNFINKWGFGISLDTRDFILSPSSGYYFNQEFTLAGGFLFGERHYIRTDTSADLFFTLWDIPVFESWNWKEVLHLHSGISFIMPQFWVPGGYQTLETTTSDLLLIDGMYIGRGWPRETNGRVLWSNWLELRMPISEQILWLDGFFDAVALWDSPEDMASMSISDFRFGMGFGIRFTIPQFPIRLYLAKRFRFDSAGNWQWQDGQLFPDSLGLDFVFSIGSQLF